ncbi:MAG: hypothetical protein HQM12_19920 [SAR324 cluster bacterium]|nr:hypothetical protein [SAR324 cluster bacterium]
MSGLSRKVNISENTNVLEEEKNPKGSLYKTVQTGIVPDKTERFEVSSEEKSHSSEIFTETTAISEVTRSLIHFFGEDVFLSLKNNPNINIPYVNIGIPLDDWVEKGLKTLFSYENIIEIGKRLTIQLVHNKNELNQQKIELEKTRQQLKEALQLNETLEGFKHKMGTQIRSSIPLLDVINIFIGIDPVTRNLTNILKESLEKPSDTVAPFILGFCHGWIGLKSYLIAPGESEEIWIRKTNEQIAKLLLHMTGLFIPQRRDVLNEVAKLVSLHSHKYDFISPEDSLQIDPKLHKAEGLGSLTFREAVSFVVVNRITRQTIIYADIKV